MPSTSVLSISGISLGDYSVRGLTMTLTPIPSQNGLRRSIEGTLLDLTSPQFHKYAATISCTDHEAPPLTDIWQGTVVTVTCVPELGPENDTGGVLVLEMMVDTWQTSRDEYGAETAWSINLLEV